MLRRAAILRASFTPLTPRAGFTLVELLVVLVLGGIVLGLASAIGVRLQRELEAQSSRIRVDEQLAAGAEVLPMDLRALSPSAGDIVAASARDTSLEIRATIGSAVVCAAASHTLTLAWYGGAAGQSVAPRAAAGDTLWLLQDGDDGEQWRAVALTTMRAALGVCAVFDGSAAQVIDRSHVWAADVRDSGTVQTGSVVRVTRPERFNFYRAGDGDWYLGLRTWNSGIGAFNSVQPIAGPYRAPTSPHGVRLSYYDSTGVGLAPGSIDPRGIARIEALLAVDGLSGPGAAIDSMLTVVGMRNRDD